MYLIPAIRSNENLATMTTLDEALMPEVCGTLCAFHGDPSYSILMSIMPLANGCICSWTYILRCATLALTGNSPESHPLSRKKMLWTRSFGAPNLQELRLRVWIPKVQSLDGIFPFWTTFGPDGLHSATRQNHHIWIAKSV